MLTVGELRKELEGVRDDMPVYIYVEEQSESYSADGAGISEAEEEGTAENYDRGDEEGDRPERFVISE